MAEDLPVSTTEVQARAAALAAFSAVQSEPVAVVSFASAGHLLVIGEAAIAAEAIARLPVTIDCLVLSPVPVDGTGAAPAARIETTENVTVMRAAVVRVTGHLGAFLVTVKTPAGERNLPEALGDPQRSIDLVLDLTDEPFIGSQILPIGYYAPGGEHAALARAVQEIPGLVGEFEKPQYFRYDPDICAHARSGIVACRRCLDACPAGSISSLGDRITVDSNLCQGVGVCATACPTGAIRYAYPPAVDTLAGIRKALACYRAAGGSRPALLFYADEPPRNLLGHERPRLPGHVIPLAVEEVGSVGMEVWLASLAYGAAHVILLAGSDMPGSCRRELEAQLNFAHALLDGMGYPAGSVRLITADAVPELVTGLEALSSGVEISPASFAALDEKRTVLKLAVEYLFEHAPAPRPLISLPAGAPFGEVWFEASRCTLCLACASQCPGGALLPGGDVPQLSFIEDNCVQCGMCARTCPEDAIGPSPRYLFAREPRQQRRLLKEEAPFLCIRCGKPFATRSVIDRMVVKLRAHPMFQGDALERLRMCEDCRVRDIHDQEEGANPVIHSNKGQTHGG